MGTEVKEEVQGAVVQKVDVTAQFLSRIEQLVHDHWMDFLIAAIMAVLGLILARWCRRIVRRMMEHAQVDRSAVGFVSELAYWTILVVAGVMVLAQIGVSTTFLSAAVGGIGIGIGLAMKDNFANLASGIFILLFRPFSSGDYIETAGFSGTVVDILTMYTRIRTQGNELILIPNSLLTDSAVKNFSHFPTRNIEFIFDVDYTTDLPQCISLLTDIFSNDPGVLNKGNIPIYVEKMTASSIRVYARPEVKGEIFFAERNRLYIRVKETFEKYGISIPYPQIVLRPAGKE